MEKKAFLDWSIELLEQIEASAEKKEWCRQYSFRSGNPGQERLERELLLLIRQSHDAGLVITNYSRAAELYRLDEKQLINPSLDRFPYLGVLACIAWHFKRDHLLIGESIAEGVIVRLLRRLRELQPSPYIATTLETLYRLNCINIPDAPGVYRVLAPQGMEIHFMGEAANRSAALYPAEELADKYSACSNKEVLYIGKANGKHGLRQRLGQYMKYGWNKATNHKGGRAIWQIENFSLLLLEYEPCTDCEAREHQLLEEYKTENNGRYPLANWRG